MNEETLVKVDGVSKKFCRSLKRSLWYGVQDVTSEMIGRKGHQNDLRKNEFWALEDVSFELKRGECLGLIGPNGAGKSTLLKILNGLVKPDRGRVTMRGKVGALIELGAGFNPILTARENIYVNGSVLGFTTKEISKKFDAIVDFAEIGSFVDTPVQNFSSGMKVRLGFAIAGQMEPNVLLVDEVLAVGDAGFRAKCIDLIAKIIRNSSVILVSHAMQSVARVASRSICLREGHIDFEGDTSEAIIRYLQYGKLNQPRRTLNGELISCSVAVSRVGSDHWGEHIDLNYGDGLEVRLSLNLDNSVKDYGVNIGIIDQEGTLAVQVYSTRSGSTFKNSGGETITARIEELPLKTGRFYVNIFVVEVTGDGNFGRVFGAVHNAAVINVSDRLPGFASVQLRAVWDAS